ncbi:MAG TPA: alpha/beta hydrolase, partial [Pseudomonadales bacterium]|nr:alpha/beta hydrolase [Pseudomonadales bacterium]
MSHISPPNFMLRLLESRAPGEAGQLMMQLPLLRLMARRGNGEAVLVLPGFMADDLSTLVLRRYLSAIGYTAQGWGLGVNRGRMMDFLPALIEKVAAMADAGHEKVRLVGWSRGGIMAREIARERPDLVHQVITIG